MIAVCICKKCFDYMLVAHGQLVQKELFPVIQAGKGIAEAKGGCLRSRCDMGLSLSASVPVGL